MEIVLEKWADLEADGASCVVDLVPTGAGDLVVLTCEKAGIHTSWWLEAVDTLVQIASVIAI